MPQESQIDSDNVSEEDVSSSSAAHSGKSSPEESLNRSIIQFLQRDGRMAFSEIAQQLNVSEGTIRNRVANMKSAGMLQIVAIADPVASEYRTDAMLGVKIAPGHTPQAVAERLSSFRRVVYILWTSGRFDLLVEVVSNDSDAFLDFLNTEIHGQPDITSCEVMTGLKNYKNQFLLKHNWE